MVGFRKCFCFQTPGYLHAQLLVHAAKEQSLPAMVTHGIFDLHLLKCAVRIMVTHTRVQIEIEELIRWHCYGLIAQLGLHIVIIPACANIVMPADNALNGIPYKIYVDGSRQMVSGEIDIGYVLAIDVRLGPR